MKTKAIHQKQQRAKANSTLTAMQKAFIALMLGAFLHSNLSANDAANPCGALLCILGGQTSGECKKYYEYYAYELPKSCYGNAACIATKQISHLKNCKMEGAPANATIDTNLAHSYGVTGFTQNLDGKINEMGGMDGECTKSALNRVESKLLRTEIQQECNSEGDCYNKYVKIYGYRINPTPTKTCQILTGQEYSVLKINYTCPKTFYEKVDWDNGYTKQVISKADYENLASKDREYKLSYKEISKKAYNALPKDEKRKQEVYDNEGNSRTIYQQIITTYYQRIWIKKDCWVVEERKFG